MPEFVLRYECGDNNEETLKSTMGSYIDYKKMTVTETNSFQWGNEKIELLRAINEDTCLLSVDSENVKQVNKHSEKEKQFKVNVSFNDMCVTNNNEVYFTDYENNSICCLSPYQARYLHYLVQIQCYQGNLSDKGWWSVDNPR